MNFTTKDQCRIHIRKNYAEFWTNYFMEDRNFCYRKSFRIELKSSGPFIWYNNSYSHTIHELAFRAGFSPYMAIDTIKTIKSLPGATMMNFQEEAHKIIAETYILVSTLDYYEWSTCQASEEILQEATLQVDELKVVNGRVKALYSNARKAKKRVIPMNMQHLLKMFKTTTSEYIEIS